MARPVRVQFENAVYHVTARGNERRPIYRDDEDRARFLETLAEACDRFALVVHAYCLMPNHYHLLPQTPRANLSEGLGWLQTTYSIRFNRRHRGSGHLFQGRFKAQLVEADNYAARLITYMHLNPVRPPGKRRPLPVERRRALRRYRWSSHRAYAGLAGVKEVPPWLCLEWLSYFGRSRNAARAEYRRTIASMFGQPVPSPLEELRGGLVLGGEALWEKARKLLGGREGQEEIRWRQRADRETVRRRIDEAVAREPDRRVQIWLRVRLGAERMTEVARLYGYRDGSGIHRVVNRLESHAQRDRDLAAKLQAWQARLSSVKS